MFFIHCFVFYTSKLGICTSWLHFFEYFSEAKALSIIQAFYWHFSWIFSEKVKIRVNCSLKNFLFRKKEDKLEKT